jgi:hypothetical protein
MGFAMMMSDGIKSFTELCQYSNGLRYWQRPALLSSPEGAVSDLGGRCSCNGATVARSFFGERMNSHISYALAHPVFDPERQITRDHGWRLGRISVMLTVNVGME